MKRRTFLTLLASAVSERALAQATVVSSCGSVTLTAGTPHNVTIDVNGQSCQSGASGGTPTSVWSAADAAANGMTLSNGGLTVTAADGANYGTARGTISKATGKLYIEFKMTGGVVDPSTGDPAFGLATDSFTPTNYLGTTNYSMGFFSGAGGAIVTQYANLAAPSSAFTSNYTVGGVFPQVNDVWAIAVDLIAGKLWMAQNSVWFGGGNPATGANSMATFIAPLLGQPYYPAMTLRHGASQTGVWTLQSTAASQKYAPPSGFTPWG